MAWIKSNQNLKEHPKLLMLCDKTGWGKAEAIGRLHMFWWWVLDYAEDGDLSRISFDVSIGNVNLNVLAECGFIDGKTKLVHDWIEYAGRYLYAKYHQSNPSKLKQIERKYKAKHKDIKRLSFDAQKGVSNFPLDRQTKTDRLRQIQIDEYKETVDNLLKGKTPEFMEAWEGFLQSRKVRPKSHGKKLLLQKLVRISTDEKVQIESLNRSAMNGWGGVFPLKGDSDGTVKKPVGTKYAHLGTEVSNE